MPNADMTRRKRSSTDDCECGDCGTSGRAAAAAAAAPAVQSTASGAPSACIKISIRGQIRRFRVPIPLSVDSIRMICQHCYGLGSDISLAYRRETDHVVVPFDSSEELLGALVADNKVSDRGELLLSSCIRIVATDHERKKVRLSNGADYDRGGGGVGGGVGVGGGGSLYSASVPSGNGGAGGSSGDDGIPPLGQQREISVDSIGSFGITNRMREQLLNGLDIDDLMSEEQELDFTFVVWVGGWCLPHMEWATFSFGCRNAVLCDACCLR